MFRKPKNYLKDNLYNYLKDNLYITYRKEDLRVFNDYLVKKFPNGLPVYITATEYATIRSMIAAELTLVFCAIWWLQGHDECLTQRNLYRVDNMIWHHRYEECRKNLEGSRKP